MSHNPDLKPTAQKRSPFLAWCRRHLKVPVTGVLIATFTLWSTQTRGATGTWIFDGAGGLWTNSANWKDGYMPIGPDDVANFNFNITANRTVTMDSIMMLHGLVFGDSLGAQGYTIAGTETLQMEASGGQNAFVNKYNSATDVWQTPLQLNAATDFNIHSGVFQINGAGNAQVPLTSSNNIYKNGSGTLQLNGDLSAFSGNFVLNFGTLTIGGVNSGVPSLGTGTSGLILNGSGSADRTILSLQNNGTGSNGVITYQDNNDVELRGAVTINVDRNFVGGANTGNTIVLDNLNMGGGILQTNGGNSYALRFDGTTTLGGQTNVFSPNSAQLTLAGPVTDGSATRALIKEGAGRLVISNVANTYNGPTAIKDGVLQLSAGANLGTGITYINGGALSPQNKATLDATSTTGLVLVGQLGTSRYVLPAIGISQSYGTIDAANPVNVNVPVAGMALAIDSIAGNVTNNIDLAQVGSGSNRVWVTNLLGADRTYQGVITPSADNTIRLTSGGNTLIISGSANRLGGPGSTAKLVFGFDHSTPANVGGAVVTQAQAGTVSVRTDNDTSGGVTIHRAITVNANGAGLIKPLGTGVVTMLGGTLNTDATNDVKLGNTDFRLFGGSTLLLDNSAVTTANSNRRLDVTSNVSLSSSILRLLGDGGAATISSQAVNDITYRGGSTIAVDTDGGTAGRLTSLTAGTLTRADRGTLNIRNAANNATTFGTATGTQKLIVTTAPAITNGMIGANVALWGGANSNDAGTPLFATYDATHGIQAAATTPVTTPANLAAATATTIASINGVAVATSGNATVQALNLRSTASSHTLTGNTITIGASAGAGQGAGLFLAHTTNDTITHSSNFTFGGGQEGLIYAATPGGGSGVIALSGVIAGTNGVTRFGDGILRLSGTNTFTGPLTLNSGETRLNNIAAAGGTAVAPNTINLYGGSLYLELANSRYYTNLNVYDNARLGNVNVVTGLNNITIQPRTGSTEPVALWVQAQAGSNITTAYGSLNVNGPLQLLTPHVLQVNGGITGTGPIDKYFNERLILAGNSSGYAGAITSYTSAIVSYNSTTGAKPFGTGPITLNPGSGLILAAPSNINAGQVTMRSDHGGISYIGQLYVADPVTTLPTVNMTSSAPWNGAFAIGAVGFNENINQSTLFGGNTYLGGAIGYTGIYTGSLTPAASGYLLGTAQGLLRVAKPLTGSSNAILGISMTGDSSRADQFINNSGGGVQYDVPMTYSGNTILNPGPYLRISAKNALSATGDLILAGGQLRVDSASGQNRMLAPISITNNIIMTADSTIQMENSAYDMRIGGSISLAPGSTGVVRTLNIGSDQPGGAQNNAGMVYVDGGITDGVGGSGNHFVKGGPGTIFFTGTNTYSGSTTIAGGLIGVNGDADWGNTSLINMLNGGIAVWENSFETSRNYHVQGSNGYFDIGPGLTLTQSGVSVIDGTSSIIKRGLGTMVLNGTNAVTGIYSGDGILQFNSQGSLGDASTTSSFSFGNDQTIGGAGSGTRYTGGTVRINFSGTTARGIVFNNNGNTNFSGGIDVTAGNIFTVTGAITQGSELDYGFKTGAGTLLTTGTNTLRGLAVTNGTLQFATSTPWANSTTTAADNTFIEMIGGTIYGLNAAANIALTNQASTTTYNYSGGSHLRMGSGAGFSVEFAADNLLRQNQGTLVIETDGGTSLGGVGGSNTGRLIVTSAVNASLARASALNNGIFGAHLVGADSSGSAYFLANDATTGFVPYAGASQASLSGNNPTAIGNITGPDVLTGTNSIYAFKTSADVSGGTLKVTAIDNVKMGGVLINGSNTISSNLVFDPTSATAPGTGIPGEALVYVKTGESAVLSGNVTSNAFTKFGRGTLTLSGATSVLGELSVQEGTLKVGNSLSLNRLNSELNLNAGATLDLNGANVGVESIGSNNRQIAGANVGGTITNGNSSMVSTLMMAGPVSSAFNGNLNLGIKLVKAGSGQLVLNGYSASTPDAGANTFTGGTDIYGVTVANITGGATNNGSASVTVTSTAGLIPGMVIAGTGIPANSYITAVTNATTFTINQNATATNTGLTLSSVGGLTVNNAPQAFGGYGGSTAGDVNLYSGNLNLLFSNGNTGVNGTQGMNFNNQVIKLGAENTNGVTLNVRGPGVIYVNQGLVSSNGTFGQGNIVQVGALNMTNTTLTLGGGNLYRFRAAGPISILGSQAAFQTNQNDGPSGAIELTGVISGNGALTKLGDGTLRGIVITNPANTYSGGTNIVAGDVQVTPTSGTPLGTGPVRVFPEGSLRIAGNGSINGANLTVMSRVNAMGAVVIDDNFVPSVLTSSNFSSVYNTALQLGQPYFTQALNMSSIGDGKAFLGGGLNAEVAYTAATLGAGVPDAWNPGVGVYRLAPGASSFAFSGTDNVLSGTNYLQVGPQRNNVLGAIQNGGNIVVIRNSNSFTAGTQIARGASIFIETGGKAAGETPLGTGAIEVYGELRIRGGQGSLWNAATSSQTNVVNLRPGGVIRLHEADGAVAIPFVGAGEQGRWGDSVGVDLNGGEFRYDGAANLQSFETIGDVIARKRGMLTSARNTGGSSAQLNVGNITRAERGVLHLNYNSGFLGIPATTPLSYERIVATAIDGAAPVRGGTTTNGAGVVNGGMLAPWIIDRTTNSFVGYDPTAVVGTGFQPLISNAAPAAGQLSYNRIITAGPVTTVVAGDIVDFTTAAKTLGQNITAHALRTSQNVSPTAAFNTVTLESGGLIMTGGTINPTGAVAAGVVSPMTLNFGAGGAGEAFIYNSGTAVIQAQIVAGQGLTKSGAGQLQIHSINPGVNGPVTLHEGVMYVRVPYSTSGTPVGQVFNGQDIIVNGGTLNLQSYNANAAGTASEIASNVASSQSLLSSNIFIRGDSVLRNNGQAQYVRISDLTIGNSAGSTAMNGNSSITLELQSGLWVGGTTTLAPEARINGTFSGLSQTTLAGLVTGAGGIIKYGNGATTLLNPGNNFAGGITVWGSTAATATSTVASAYRGTGTPFSTGDITIQPGGHLRVADNANIASNAVYLRSDGIGLGGIGIAHNGILPSIIASGTPSAGQIKVESVGPFDGVLSLDYGYYSRELNPSTITGGNWWVGNSQQAEAFYFNDSIGAASNGKYLLGGGGNQSGVTFGGALVSGNRAALFENLFSGGSANSVRLEIGAQTADFAWNAPAFVNGNIGYITLLTRNTGLTGDVRVNTGSALAIGNNFALGSGRLIFNGGLLRADVASATFGNTNNFVTNQITLDNNVVLQGDWGTAAVGNELVLNGNVAMSDVAGSGATRTWALAGTAPMAVGLTSGSTTNGVISGAAGSNIIKTGSQVVAFRGTNTYQGYTQIAGGSIIAVGNVMPNVAGALGVSDSPIALAGGSLGIGGKFEIGRDIVVTGTGTVEARTNETSVISGGISIATGATLTLGGLASGNGTGAGGVLDIRAPISGGGAVVFGTTAAAPNANGPVTFGTSNGYGINTYSGGTTFNTTRVEITGDTYFTGPSTNPTILSGPFGSGALTLTSGEGGNGATFLAIGGARTVVNAINPTASDADATFKFMGNQSLTFARDWNMHSGGNLRTRSIQVSNPYAPATLAGNLSTSGAQGMNFVKSGAGLLVLSGTNTFANLLTSNANYGTGVFVDAGILRVSSDAALGSTATLAAGQDHAAGPADIRLRGGILSVASGFTTARQVIFATSTTASGIDVAAGQTLALSTATRFAAATNAITSAVLTKTGPGTLALNNAANVQTSLVLGGAAQLNPAIGRFSHTGGVVSTTATSGAPFVAVAGTNTITINSGTLALIGGGIAQALSVPRIAYGPAGHIALNQGTTSSQLTMTDAAFLVSMRSGAFNSVNYGTLVLNPSLMANLGSTEKFLVPASATPLVFQHALAAEQGVGKDASFLTYDVTNGFVPYTGTPTTSLAATAPGTVGDISGSGDTAGAGLIELSALRTAGNIAPTDGTTLVRLGTGGLIINGSSAPTISANMSFNSGSATIEALTYVRDGQGGPSIISGNIEARDFTKFGPGDLELSGTSNLLAAGATRHPVLSVQDGTFRFASAAAQFVNQNRPTSVTGVLGNFSLNVNEAGVFDMNGLNTTLGGLGGNGTVTNSSSGAVSLIVRNGFGVDTTFSGLISNGSGTVGLTKSGNGVLTLNGHGSYTGGTVIEAGRVTSATGTTGLLGRVDVNTVGALGTGPITLAGGDLRFIATTLLNGTQTTSEVVDGIDSLLFGGPNGYDITVPALASSNGISVANVTSNLRSNTQNALINSLTVNAPIFTSTEGLVMVRGSTTLTAPDTVLRMAGGRLFFQGRFNAGTNTVTKTGAQDFVLSHTEGAANQNSAGLWRVYGGIINARSASGAANPLGLNPTVEINGGSTNYGLLLSTDGDGTAVAERVTTYANTSLLFGSTQPVTSANFVSSGAGRLAVDRILSNNDDKTVVVKDLQVRGALGSAFTYFIASNASSIWVNGTTNFDRDWHFQADGTAITFNDVISGDGTVSRRSNGASVYFNAVNNWNGGTFFNGGGRNLFGSYEGNQVTLSTTAKLGTGHVFQGPLSVFQINDAGNLRAGQNMYVSGNLSWPATFSLAADISLEQVRLRALGLGGIQGSSTDYYLNAVNPSSSVLALGTVYNQALDQRAIGDGMWFIGSATNHVGANGSYDASTLAPGLGNTYRLGAGGATLFVGSNGNQNVLTDYTCPTNLIVGAPMTVQNGGAWTTGTVVLLGSQNFTGSTVVNRGSALDFRGTLTTSGIETYGIVNAAGEAGTFINPVTNANIPVTLRPGATLRFDNTSAGVLSLSATQGRWQDSVGINLNDNVLRLQGNTAVEVVETVGAIEARNGGNRIDIVRGVVGRGTELRTPSITRVGNGTIQFIHNSSQLGSDERVMLTGPAPTVTNGMVAPWMVSNSDTQFITYNADTGFTIAGFDAVHAGGTSTGTLNFTNNRLFFSTAATVIGTGFDINAYAVRLDQNITLAAGANNTTSANRLILGSGGLISNGTRTITAGVWAGTGGLDELLLYNNGTTAIGDFANPNTAGQIRAGSITKFGAGNFQLLGNNPGFTGDIRIQQGTVELNYRNTTDVTTHVTTTIGGNGGNVIFQGAGTVLNLLAGQGNTGGTNFTGTTVKFAKGLVLGDYVPVATVFVDRSTGSAATAIQSKTVILSGGITFGQSNGDIGQLLRVDLRNIYNLRVEGTTTLNGRSSIAVEDAAYGSTAASTLYLSGQVTGTGTLIKGPSDSKSRVLELNHVNALNNYTAGTVLQGGILRSMARATNVAVNTSTNLVAGGLGDGDITLMQGILDLRVDSAVTGAADTEREFVRYTSGSGAGPNLIVNGSSTINVDRNFYTGTYTRAAGVVTAELPGGHGFVNGQSINVSTGANTGNFTITSVTGNTITYADATGSATSGNFVANNNSGTTKVITFNNLTIGSQTLSITGGNSYEVAVAGTTTLLGNTVLNSGVNNTVLGGGAGASGTSESIVTDGGKVMFNKIGTGTLWVHSTNNNLNADVYVNAGLLAFGNAAVGNTTATFGKGNIFVNPGAAIQVRALTNVNTAANQKLVLTGTPYSSSIFRSVGAFTQANYQTMISSGANNSNQVAIIALETNNANALDFATIGNGRLYLGANGDRNFTGPSIAPGLANLPNSVIGGTSTNPVYRFTHTSGNTLSVNLSTGGIGNLGGTTPTDVQIGNQAILGPSGNTGSSGFVYFQDQNTYTGQTVVSRFMTLRFNTSMAAADAAGPLGIGSAGAALVDVYGGLRIEASGSVRNVAGTANYYSNIRLHPLSNLVFQDAAATGANSNRWDDTTGVKLDGSLPLH